VLVPRIRIRHAVVLWAQASAQEAARRSAMQRSFAMPGGIGRTQAAPDPAGAGRDSLRGAVEFRRDRRPNLGALERAVLERLWAGGAADVKAVHRDVGAPRGISPNTVHSALERLVRKRLAERRKLGRAFEYAAAVSRHDFVRDALSALLEAEEPGLLAAAFVDLTARAGPERLAELEALLRERRRRPGG
jgi:predicted transcriptional regulator